MKMIVAVDNRWGIGKNGDLLLSIPDDMRYYRETTRGKVVAMGYNTLLSLPNSKPQPARLNLVLADIAGLRVGGAVVCDSMDQLLALIARFAPEDVFIIGGGSIYRQMIPYCTDAHITKMRFDGEADTSITNLDELPSWSISQETAISEYEGIPYSFAIYHNSEPLSIPGSPAPLSSSMTAYFRKREPIAVACPADADSAYRAALGDLLTAYFCPLREGVSADEVRAYLSDSSVNFEEYLRGCGWLAAPEDFDALAKRYAVDKSAAVTVSKDTLDDLLRALAE